MPSHETFRENIRPDWFGSTIDGDVVAHFDIIQVFTCFIFYQEHFEDSPMWNREVVEVAHCILWESSNSEKGAIVDTLLPSGVVIDVSRVVIGVVGGVVVVIVGISAIGIVHWLCAEKHPEAHRPEGETHPTDDQRADQNDFDLRAQGCSRWCREFSLVFSFGHIFPS